MFNFSPKVVTDGLVLALDAANPRSYPGSGTSWRDLTANNNNGTLTNGPSFNSANGGSIQFDGVDDYVTSIQQSYNIQDNTPFTVSSIFKTGSPGTMQLIGNWDVFVSPGWRLDISSGIIRFVILNSMGAAGRFFFSELGGYNDNIIKIVTATYNGSQSDVGMKVYVNGISINKSTSAFNTSPGTLINTFIVLGASKIGDSYTNFLNGSIYYTSLYNRELSQLEVLQNYNALKSRFNLT